MSRKEFLELLSDYARCFMIDGPDDAMERASVLKLQIREVLRKQFKEVNL